jgi:5-oxoprolinase (ATP-hydrolysing)
MGMQATPSHRASRATCDHRGVKQGDGSDGPRQRWQFWIDRGGTFTDIVARRPDGSLVTHKLLSDSPEQYADAAVAGIRHLLDIPAGRQITSDLVECVKMGTTVATNALLERRGEPTVLVITKGFGDSLRIGYQERPRIFDRHIVLADMLYTRVIEADERLSASGQTIRALDQQRLRDDLAHAFDGGLRSVAIVLLHSYCRNDHELLAEGIARSIGFTQISVSHQVSPLIKLIGRGDTTVVDAYLSPVLRRYVGRLAADLPGVRLLFMQSSGGLADASGFRGKDAILSGPAGGVVGMATTARLAGFDRVVGFDMGGTSTDVSHFAGEYERSLESQVAGVRLRAPMLTIHTVAAGGGSVVSFDGSRFRVGPQSAGADPGPRCYRRGGPLTITDANVVLGKIQPNSFPHVFGPAADEPLDGGASRLGFFELAEAVGRATASALSPESVAEGFVDVAVGAMANAVKKISVARGHDVTTYCLHCFGGAAGQHACRVADTLGITRILVHPLAGVLSAYGMGLADQLVIRQAAIELPLPQAAAAITERLAVLTAEATGELLRQGVAAGGVVIRALIDVRYTGTDSSFSIPFDMIPDGPSWPEAVRTLFEDDYRRRFGFVIGERPLVVETLTVEAVGGGETPTRFGRPAVAVGGPSVTVQMFTAGRWTDASLVRRADTRPGDSVNGPAIIVDDNATTVIEPGWQASVTDVDDLVLERRLARPARQAIGTNVDPVHLEVFNNLFMNIAEQMGLQLQKTAHSVNIKERLDFSCALFDAAGNLIANAPHMPVHLGSMSESIKAVISRHGESMRPGDVYALNDPYHGGTHLPDVTVVTPLFDRPGDGAQRVVMYVASRGHHADIGGITPGSMPPFSTHIEEEGVQIDNVLFVSGGRLREAAMLALLTGGAYPARNPHQNIADLHAQIAANEQGAQQLAALVEQYGLDVVCAYMGHVQDNGEESVRRVIANLTDGDFTLTLDNGAVIKVAIRSIPPSAAQ